MTDEPVNGQEPVMDDRAEMALRHRITALEEWQIDAAGALGLLVIGMITLGGAYIALMLLLRKRLP